MEIKIGNVALTHLPTLNLLPNITNIRRIEAGGQLRRKMEKNKKENRTRGETQIDTVRST